MKNKKINLKICGIPYTATIVKDRFDVDHTGEGASLWGQISYTDHSIRVMKSSKEQEFRTLLHEIIHGVVEGLCIRELMDADSNHLERPVTQLASGLAETLESMGIRILT